MQSPVHYLGSDQETVQARQPNKNKDKNQLNNNIYVHMYLGHGPKYVRKFCYQKANFWQKVGQQNKTKTKLFLSKYLWTTKALEQAFT